jgi:hypothetical protein
MVRLSSIAGQHNDEEWHRCCAIGAVLGGAIEVAQGRGGSWSIIVCRSGARFYMQRREWSCRMKATVGDLIWDKLGRLLH